MQQLLLVRGSMKKYTHIIWDFNGTILDDVAIGVEAINVLLEKRGLDRLDSLATYRQISGFPIIDYYKRLGFDFSKEPYQTVAHEWVAEYMSRMDRADLYPGAHEMLTYLGQRGYHRILLSATELKMLQGQLEALSLAPQFDQILGMDNVYAHGKLSIALSWRRQNPSARVLFVGDTDHDYEVAMAMDADCLLFDGGHQSRERLVPLGCPVISELPQILNFL